MKKIILIIACLIISFFIDAQTPPPCYTAITSASMAIVAQGASSIVSGDFNSDGIADMATCGTTNSLLIYMGKGNGIFAAPQSYTMTGTGNYMITKDFNADGNADLAISIVSQDLVVVLYGSGTGTFTQWFNMFSGFGTNPVCLISSDFNGDGKPDLATANSASNKISVFINNTNSWGFQTTYLVGSGQRSITCGDFNGDGKADLATANYYSGNVSILIGTGTGSFTSIANYIVGTNPISITNGDFNMDGKVDLAVTNVNSNNVSILIGSGTGTFTPTVNYTVGIHPKNITIGDFNADGKVDLATANNGSNDVSILIGMGSGTFSVSNYNVGNSPVSLSLGDFNMDGSIDIAVANESYDKISILTGNTIGTFLCRIINSPGSNQNSITTNDFNGDGKADIAVANYDTDDLSIFNGLGTGSFVAVGNYSVGSKPTSVATGDFNGDGIADLATANNNTDNVSVLIGNSSGASFMTVVNYSVGTMPYSLTTGDFNIDGKMDLTVANYGSNDVSILIGTGSGTFLAPINYVVGTAPSYIATGDFNSDGIIDLVVVNFVSNDFSILIGLGNGAFATSVNYPIVSKPLSVACNDFNGDGNIDLAVSYLNSGFSISLGTGIGTFQGPSYMHFQNDPVPIISADFSGDGKADLAMVNRISNNISVYTVVGTGTFALVESVYANGLAPVSAVSGDFNGDGKIDIVATNNNSNSLITLLSDNPPIISITGTNSVCIGSSAILSTNGALTYTWSTGDSTSSINVIPLVTETYSVVGTNAVGCTNSQTISVTVDSTCANVWPGDANSDGVADNLDVLELGLHYTQTGISRVTTSNLWQSYYSDNWTGTMTNGKNLNHCNCNGDGIINDDDTLAIYNNYSLTHAFKPEQSTTNPQVTIVPDQSTVNKGTWGTSSIYLGDASMTISNINGVAFTLNYNNTLLETDSVWIEYPTSFINVSNYNLKFRKRDFINGKLYTATTHTISANVTGYGKIATLHYKIKSSLTTDNVLNISLGQVHQSNASGVITPLTSGSATLMAIGNIVTTKLNELSNGGFISMLPNPANDVLAVELQMLQNIEATLEVTNAFGQVVLVSELINNKELLNISTLSNGVYFVKVISANQQIGFKKIVVQR